MGTNYQLKKCKLMHFRHNNHKYQYSWGIDKLNVSYCEKILGILIDDKLTY